MDSPTPPKQQYFCKMDGIIYRKQQSAIHLTYHRRRSGFILLAQGERVRLDRDQYGAVPVVLMR